jgi:hypothetical protein
MAYKTTEGIRNTTTFFEKEYVEKIRLPRTFGKNGELIVFFFFLKKYR